MTIEVNVFIENVSHSINNGKWYDLTDSTDCEDLKELLEDSAGCEFIISDYEAPFNIEQYANINYLIELVSKAQELSEDYEKLVFFEEAEWCEDLDKLVTDIEQYYRIIYIDGGGFSCCSNSHEALGYYMAEQILDLDEFTERYFDYEAFGRDCAFDYTEIVLDDAYLFYSC
ncbi:antirestriction protein ArdA [Macrococcus armenti]|uniref:antirestriction protein ArdA n=1 Tax=Macrococcus armenti TaxID=2875764 RepID=UPI001CCC1784|nr:antirestriction protein ArdA [Macrococcus armenti]UBH21888.1 antirestriction protein ArdA [Macrococcus armenti]